MSSNGDSGQNGNVIELTKRATEPLNPAEGLSAVAELRRRLDSIEFGYVEDALYEGWSWSRIAGCLGISRQAAHRKYAKPLKAKKRRWQRIRGEVTVPPDIQRIVRRATAEAQIMGHHRMCEGHLLLAIASSEEGRAFEALADSGISVPRLREQVMRLHGGASLFAGNAVIDAGPSAPVDDAPALPVAAAAKRALRESVDEAKRLNSREVRPEHLLLALLRPSEGPIPKLLLRLGLLPEDIRDRMRGELSTNSAR
jgi:ATP-dependent Clp protease ATP-binding subunit ClpA